MHREMPTNVLLAHVLLWFAWLLLASYVLLSPLTEAGAFLMQHKGELLALSVMVIANVGALFGKPWARALLIGGVVAGALLLVVAVGSGATQLRGAGRLLFIALALGGLASYLLASGSGASWFSKGSNENAL